MLQDCSVKELCHDIVYKCYWRDRLFDKAVKPFVYTIYTLTNELENRILATKKTNPESTTSKPNLSSTVWINRQLTDDEKEQHDTGNITPQNTFKSLLQAVLQGYNISVKWDAYSSCFQATLIPYNTASPNYGYGLSARASDPHRALSLLFFKHYEVLQENWSQAYKPSSKSFEG